ncbi:hypothetical protein MNV49_006264 [Pseudohyphozyma bogoriensis]|nr:hypothetical protein MNV49_006264 [Pseudohyphozyma bogoriensis]
MNRAVFKLTSSTPSTITEEEGVGSRTTVAIHDFDGEGKQYDLASRSVAKISIFNAQNLTLRITSRILTSTLELHSCHSLNLHLESHVGIVQLDAPLTSTCIAYASPEKVGSIILSTAATSAAPRGGRESFGYTDVKLVVGEEGDEGKVEFVLADGNGGLRQPGREGGAPIFPGQVQGMPEQWKIGFDETRGQWDAGELMRNERNYPAL